jgi:hypothetical protein
MNKWIGYVMTGALLAPTAAIAAPDSPATVAIAIEIGESKNAKPVSLVLTLSGEHGCAMAEDLRAGLEHRAEVCREGGTATAPVLAFDIQRNKANGNDTERRHFKLRAKVAAGAPKLLGQIGQGDEKFEIRAGLLN